MKSLNETMENILNTANQPSITPCENINNGNNLNPNNERNVRRLWVVGVSLYGSKWSAQFGAEPIDVHFDLFNALTDEQWVRGVSKLKSNTDPWPPSPIEFRNWAVGALNREQAKAAALIEFDEQQQSRSYNPNVTPPTYQELDVMRRNYVARRTMELTNNIDDFEPTRIEMDERNIGLGVDEK